MQANGIKPDQVTQVRGFADQRLRKIDAPLDPANRRISLIVQYIMKNQEEDPQPAAGEEKSAEAKPSGTEEKQAKKD